MPRGLHIIDHRPVCRIPRAGRSIGDSSVVDDVFVAFVHQK
jgi:hypothetical protein